MICNKKMNIPLFKTSCAAMAVSAALLVCPQVYAIDLNVYGVGHLSIDNVNDGDESSLHFASSSSRLGFTGGYDLSPGLRAIFQYETGVDLTNQGTKDGNGDADSGGQLFTRGRPSYLGLEGGFGKIILGHLPALDQWANDYNLFADQVGDLGNLWAASGVPGRVDNVIYYHTPSFGSFDAAVSYVADEGAEDQDHMIFKANYGTGKVQLSFAAASIGQGVGVGSHSAVAVIVAYRHDRFSVGGGIQQESGINEGGGNDDGERDNFYIGGSINVGQNGIFKLQYAQLSNDTDDSDGTQVAFGYDHAMGKATTLYAAYAWMSNDDQVRYSVNGKGHGDTVVPMIGDDPKVFSLGIIHKFDVVLAK